MKFGILETVLAAISLSLFGCAANPISVNTDAVTEEFTGLSQYAWHANSIKTDLTPSYKKMDDLVKGIVNEHLKAKKYSVVTEARADFFVNYELTANDHFSVKAMNVYSGFGDGFVWRYGQQGVTNETYVQSKEYNVEEFKKGTLVIDIVSAKTDKLVWRGVATKRIDQGLNNEELEIVLRDGINKLLKDIPAVK